MCNNCAAVIEENTKASIEFLWQTIDQYTDFQCPDCHGEEMTIQDCWIAFEKRYIQDTVLSLLHKMNIKVVELDENFESKKFFGVNMLSACTKCNAALVHKRYVELFPHMFTPMEPMEQIEHFRKHCEQIETEKVVYYCKFCTDAINMGKSGNPYFEFIIACEKLIPSNLYGRYPETGCFQDFIRLFNLREIMVRYTHAFYLAAL